MICSFTIWGEWDYKHWNLAKKGESSGLRQQRCKTCSQQWTAILNAKIWIWWENCWGFNYSNQQEDGYRHHFLVTVSSAILSAWQKQETTSFRRNLRTSCRKRRVKFEANSDTAWLQGGAPQLCVLVDWHVYRPPLNTTYFSFKPTYIP